MNNLEYYGAYHLGALIAANKIIDEYVKPTFIGEEKIYRDAELRLITSDKRSMQLWLDGGHRIGYRNHERNKKGKLVRCDAFFID